MLGSLELKVHLVIALLKEKWPLVSFKNYIYVCNAGCIWVTEYLSVYKFNGIINFKLYCDVNPHSSFVSFEPENQNLCSNTNKKKYSIIIQIFVVR